MPEIIEGVVVNGTEYDFKDTTIVYDDVPTANSDNPVKSQGIKTAIDDSQTAQTSLLRDTVGWTGKNKLPLTLKFIKNRYPASSSVTWNGNTMTVNGITFNFSTDSYGNITEIVTNGTANSSSGRFCGIDLSYPMETSLDYILSGCPKGGGADIYKMVARDDQGVISDVAQDTGNGAHLGIISQPFRIELRIYQGVTVNNISWKPMLRLATETDPTYEPYYIPLKQSKFDRAEQAVLGAKNLLPYPYKDSASTQNGVTYVYNSDNTITANGTATSTSWRTLLEDFSSLKLNERYILSGCPSGGSSSTYRIRATYNDGTDKHYEDYGNGVEFTNTGNLVRIQVRVEKDYTANNLVFKPMLRLASDPDDTYVPYAMTNKELTDEKADNTAIAPVENGSTASQAYAVGQHFIRDGAFCTVTQAIAQGGSFTLNTNYTAGDVADELDLVTTEVTLASGVVANKNQVKKKGNICNLLLEFQRDTMNSDVIGYAPMPANDYVFTPVIRSDDPYDIFGTAFIRGNTGQIIFRKWNDTSIAINKFYIECTYICK